MRIPNGPNITPPPEPFTFEMIYDGGRWRAYADTPADLLGYLVADYADLAEADAARARIRYAVDVSVPIQASLCTPEELETCTAGQREVLLASRTEPPAVVSWEAPVPLVLVTSFYAPVGSLSRPSGGIWWIEPATDWSLLVSLHACGWIHLARRADTV